MKAAQQDQVSSTSHACVVAGDAWLSCSCLSARTLAVDYRLDETGMCRRHFASTPSKNSAQHLQSDIYLPPVR